MGDGRLLLIKKGTTFNLQIPNRQSNNGDYKNKFQLFTDCPLHLPRRKLGLCRREAPRRRKIGPATIRMRKTVQMRTLSFQIKLSVPRGRQTVSNKRPDDEKDCQPANKLRKSKPSQQSYISSDKN